MVESDLSRLAYKAPELGGGERVPVVAGVLRIVEGDVDDVRGSEIIVDVLVRRGLDDTNNVVVVVPGGFVTVVGGPGLEKLGEYMRLFSREKTELVRVTVTVVRTVVILVETESLGSSSTREEVKGP